MVRVCVRASGRHADGDGLKYTNPVCEGMIGALSGLPFNLLFLQLSTSSSRMVVDVIPRTGPWSLFV
jgi:hypothetical protein